MIEKVQSSNCEYCVDPDNYNPKNICDFDMGFTLKGKYMSLSKGFFYVFEDQIVMGTYWGDVEINADINYCPMCGRKLRKEGENGR